MRRRFVLGLREVRRGVMARKVKAVIMTPNIEQVETKGGLDTFVSDIIEACAKDREDDDDTIEIDQIPVGGNSILRVCVSFLCAGKAQDES